MRFGGGRGGGRINLGDWLICDLKLGIGWVSSNAGHATTVILLSDMNIMNIILCYWSVAVMALIIGVLIPTGLHNVYSISRMNPCPSS